MSNSVGLTCSREGCHPELGQSCIEGLEVAECPHRNGIVVPVEASMEAEMEKGATTSTRTVRVHNGDAFTTVEADLFLRKNRASVIAIIGCPDAGKTTAAVMLYELIKRGRLGKFEFAGSKTIRGFQSRSFQSILSSGLTEPDTERTKGSKPVEFLHLRVHTHDFSWTTPDLLVVDRTGEDFELCMKNPDLCATFPEIPRADFHVLLVDGKKLIDDNFAALHANEVLRIFLSLVRTPLKRLQLVLTKYDKVVNSANHDLGIQRFNECEKDLRRRLPETTVLSKHYLSARPSLTDNNEELLGQGLEEIISEWFEKNDSQKEFRKNIPRISDGRPFDLLLNIIGSQS